MKKKVQVLIGCAVGIALTWYLFKDTDWAAVMDAFHAANMFWLFAGLLIILIGFFIRIWRWSYIVNPVVPVPFWSLFSATQIGFLGNFVLPARMGEVVRALALSRSRHIPIPKTMAFVAVDRVTDLFGLLTVFAITLLMFRPTADIYLPEDLQGIYAGPISRSMIRGTVFSVTALLLSLLSVMLMLIVCKNFFLRLSDAILGVFSLRLATFFRTLFEHFAEGMQVLTSLRPLAKATAVSLLLWASFALGNMTIYHAFGIEIKWYDPFVVLSLLSIFISIPGPPGFVGTFHAGVVGGLILANPEVNLNTARAVAIMAHLFNLIPIVVIGVICLSFERLELRTLSRESELLEANTSMPTLPGDKNP